MVILMLAIITYSFRFHSLRRLFQNEFCFTSHVAIFQLYKGGVEIIEAGPDSLVINSMSTDLSNWELGTMACANQVIEPDSPIPLVASYIIRKAWVTEGQYSNPDFHLVSNANIITNYNFKLYKVIKSE